MNELQLTHGFVKKLTKNIRDAYGKDIAHTQVLELVADAAGQKAGPMMHALKTQVADESETQEQDDIGSTVTFSYKIAMRVIDAIENPFKFKAASFENMDLTVPMQMLDERVPMSLFLKALGTMELWGGPREARQIVLKAYERQPALALIAASSIGETEIDDKKLTEFFGDGGIRGVADFLLSTKSNLGHRLVFLAQTAVQAGFIKFSDEKVLLATPAKMPSAYNYNISEL
jgi:hypothetical protein